MSPPPTRSALTAKRSALARKKNHPGGWSMAKKEVNLIAKVG
jgi:hypothetical protein